MSSAEGPIEPDAQSRSPEVPEPPEAPSPSHAPSRTMPPPELLERVAPASVGSLMLASLRPREPVARHAGPQAVEAHLRARIAAAQASGDVASERAASLDLARRLSSRGRELERAIDLTKRALSLPGEPLTEALHVELASWQAAIGDASGAATTLRAMMEGGSADVRALIKAAVLVAQAGDAGAARDAFHEAAKRSARDASALELSARLTWAPEAVSREAAAAAYLEAATRRASADEASYEDALRGFDLRPELPEAAEAVARALAARGATGGADEARRIHARAVRGADPKASLAVHRGRIASAARERDAARAVAAILDAELETSLEGDDARRVDEALSLAGLSELLAVRLEIRAETRQGPARAEAYEELARLSAGALASPARAVTAWKDAFVADPSSIASLATLRELRASDPWVFAEALLLAASGPSRSPAARDSILRELSDFAVDKLHRPTLARWADEARASSGDASSGSSASSASSGSSGSSALEAEDEDLEAARRALATAAAVEARIEALRLVVAAYRARPRDAIHYARAAVELARAAPTDRAALVDVERAVARTADAAPLEEILRARTADLPGLTAADIAEAHLGLARLARRQGDDRAALAAARSALAAMHGHRYAAASALFFATRLGRARERADAIVEMAAGCAPAVRAALLASAAELYRGVGAGDLARRAAADACEADGASPRALSARASVLVEVGAAPSDELPSVADRALVAAVERAMTAVLPRSSLCAYLATALDGLGDAAVAFAWTQRWLALDPASADAMRGLLTRATAMAGAPRLTDAIAWVLAQPRPLDDLAEAVLDAIDALAAVDAVAARALARKALDALGARSAAARSRLLSLADRASDAGLAIAVLERELAARTTGRTEAHGDASAILLDLAARRADASDLEGAAIELAQAAREAAADPARVLAVEARIARAASESDAWTSDMRCALAEARAAGLERQGAERASDAAAAYRELGGLLWDLVEDEPRAEAAFYRAAELTAEGGVERYGQDMCSFAGAVTAVHALTERATSSEAIASKSIEHRASLLVEAANVATIHNLPERGLLAAVEAIALDPTRADAIALVERNAHVDGGLEHLDRSYDRLASAALGCFGRRAAHYRAARQLERRGAVEAALRHAASCFEAVPSEGTALVLLSRLAERAGDPTEAVRALERVAEGAGPGARPTWLKRAAELAASGPEGGARSFDLLLRALNARPDPGAVADVAGVVRALAREGEIVDDSMRVRSERAVRVALKKLDGPDGARAAIAMASLAVDLQAPGLAFAALDRATEVDGDVDEFAALEVAVPALAEGADAARAWVDRVHATAEKPYSSVGKAALVLAAHVAASAREPTRRASLLVLAVKRSKAAGDLADDDALVEEADEAVRAVDDIALARKLDAVVSPAARAVAILRLAERCEREGLENDAIAFLDRALASGSLPTEAKSRAAVRLKALLARVGRLSDAEALLRAELGRASVPPAAKEQMARDLVDLLLKHDRRDEALEVLAGFAARKELPDSGLLAEMCGLARATFRLARYAEVLSSLLEVPAPEARRLEILRELAPILAELGDTDGAALRFEELAALDPKDLTALEAMEAHATARGDFAAAASLLARRIAETRGLEKRRMLRLRRAAVLEQRLAALDEAVVELRALLVEAPDDPSALRFLADVLERKGAPLEAAALFRRLEELASSPEDRAGYALRAAAASLAGGDVEGARRAVDRADATSPDATHGTHATVVQLRVDIARARGDGGAVASGLEELAAQSSESAEARALFLVEAARAVTGDDAGALERTRRALKLAPNLPEAVLESERLRYRAAGAGTPREAQASVDELSRIEGRLAPGAIGLHAFLLAEALDVIQGGGAGMRELSRRHAEHGPLPLLALGMAERLVRGKNFEASLPLFAQALAGDLEGLRSRGRVALAGAQAAVAAKAYTTAAELLDVAATDPETQALAERRQLELAATVGDDTVAREAVDELLRISSDTDRARWLVQLARLLAPTDRPGAERALDEASSLSSKSRTLTDQIAKARSVLASSQGRVPVLELSPLSSAAPAPPSTPAPKPVEALRLPPPVAVPKVRAPARPATSAEPASAASPPADEATLIGSFAAGSFKAGDELAALYTRSRQSNALLAVRRQQALMRLGDRAAFERLVEAALADGNPALARAVEHAARAYDARATPGIATPEPPPLAAQRLASDLVASLLFRHVAESPVHEALAIVLETGLYRRDAGQYQLAGVGRVQAAQPGQGGQAGPLGEVFTVVSRYLGQPKTALFHRRSSTNAPANAPAGPSYTIALLSPPSIVLAGDVKEDSPDLRYLLGEAVTGAMPEHALVNALPEDGLRTLLEALQAAFGPVAGLPRNAPVARLAQNLWQLVAPRADRRLRELCARPAWITYDAAVEGTRQAMRRAGLFASGDLSVALAHLAAELEAKGAALPDGADGMMRACAAHAPLADLVKLSISSEFAEARWAREPATRTDSGARGLRS